MKDRLIGKTLGDFEIESLIGSGAMGKVYRATQVSLRRPVALKVLEEGLFTPDEFKVRFRREAEYVARLEHPHVISVYQFGHQDPYIYYAMRLVEGRSLDHFLAEGLALSTGLRWLADIADALGYAHEHHVVHRDIKPANVMISGDSAYLADFGLARVMESTTITASGVLLGTLLYMSPEQVRRERATEASDLYSLGVVLYELVTARHPFAGPDGSGRPGSAQARLEVMERITQGRFARPSDVLPGVPPALESMILRAMSLAPGDRHGNARELEKELRRNSQLPELRALDGKRAATLGRPIAPSSAPRPGPEAASEQAGAVMTVPPQRPAAASPAPAAERVGRYRLLEESARTGRSVLHKAVEEERNRLVSLERFDAPSLSSQEWLARFRMEAASVAALRHAHLLTVHDAGELEGRPFFASEWIEARELENALGEGISPRRAAEIVAAAARGVAHAHTQGVVHRRLHPASLLIDGQGRVLVRGFGTADLWRSSPGTVPPSPVDPAGAYLAPEARAGGGDARSDVYGLGAIFHRLLHGGPPGVAGTVPIRIHPEALELCRKALDADPGRRLAGAEEVALALEAFARGEAPPVSTPVATRFPRAAVTVGLCVLALSLGAWRWQAVVHRDLIRTERVRAIRMSLFAGDAQHAEAWCEELLRADPDCGEALYWRVRALLHQMTAQCRPMRALAGKGRVRMPESASVLRAAVERAQGAAGLGEREAREVRGLCAWLSGDPGGAVSDLPGVGSDGRELALAAGLVRYAAGDYSAAAVCARDGLTRWRADDRLAALLARSHLALGWAAEAGGRADPRPAYRAALAVVERQRASESPDADWPILRAEARLGAARYEARTGGDPAAELEGILHELGSPASADGWLVRGEALLEQGAAHAAKGAGSGAEGREAAGALEHALAEDSGLAIDILTVVGGRVALDPLLQALADRCRAVQAAADRHGGGR